MNILESSDSKKSMPFSN